MSNGNDRDKQQPQDVIIHDLRHSRGGEAEIEVETEVESGIAPEPTPAEPAELPEQMTAEPAGAPDDNGQETEHANAEYEQMKMIFGLGLKGYLAGQLALLINFTMINLGRAPNPATGLVATDLEAAKVAIDLLERIMVFVSSELQPVEQKNLKGLISELKYSYVQVAGSAVPPVTPDPEA